MRALSFGYEPARYAMSRLASIVAPGEAARFGPLRLLDVEEPVLPGARWHRVRPMLSGICGSDLALLEGNGSRWFEPLMSFPFIPGHEIVGVISGGERDGERVVVEPVLHCAIRGISPPCSPCQHGDTGNCEMVAFGDIEPGLQTGYCAATGGGWCSELVAHELQLHPVAPAISDEAAVLVEPAACAIHAAIQAISALEVPSIGAVDGPSDGSTVVVLGAGTLGLAAIAALSAFREGALPRAGDSELKTILAVAKHPGQRSLASSLGADLVVEPSQLARAVRRLTGSLGIGKQAGRLSGGADAVLDCVGNDASVSQSISVTRPRGTVVLVGMPGRVSVDLAPLWHREIRLHGTYAYGIERLPEPAGGITQAGEKHPPHTFEFAQTLVAHAKLERLLSALYPLERFEDAITHASNAGRRGSVKIAFAPQERARPHEAGTRTRREVNSAR